MEVKTVREAVKVYSARTGISVCDIAPRISVTKQSLYSKIRGDSEWKFAEAKAMADVLGVTLEEFWEMSCAS